MIPVTKTYLPPLEEYIKKLETIWMEGWITNNGGLSIQLAEKLKDYLGVSNIELVANGTLALQLAIKALDLKGEIITTPFSYVATTTAIIWEHCNPVFVDIDERTCCIDPDLIENAITEKTSAILATHVYGYPCDVDRIERIAKKKNIKVIYDAAHAFGVRLNGRSVLDYGDVSALSFHATKLFHTTEGGALVCKDAGVAAKIGLMKRFGHVGEEDYIDIGINAKMSELHAAMGLTVLPKVDEIVDYRRMISFRYDSLLNSQGLSRPLAPEGLEYNYAYYPIIFTTHEGMMRARQALMEQGIIPRRYFYPSLNKLPYLHQEWAKQCPVSESISERVLCLPIYYGLQEQEMETICSIVSKALNKCPD